jgi:hypothetical protein
LAQNASSLLGGEQFMGEQTRKRHAGEAGGHLAEEMATCEVEG